MNFRIGRESNVSRKAALALARRWLSPRLSASARMTAPLDAQLGGLICVEAAPVIRQEVQSVDDKIRAVDGTASEQTVETLAQKLLDRYPDDSWNWAIDWLPIGSALALLTYGVAKLRSGNRQLAAI